MKRTGYLGMSLFLIAIVALAALPGFGQAAQGKTPQLRTQPEYNSYTACLNEKADFAKKADLCEKFVNEFKDSDFLVNGYKMIIQSYLQTKNWQKVMETADKLVALPAADNASKDYAYESALTAAQNANNLDKVIAYGEKDLTVNPNNLNTLIVL